MPYDLHMEQQTQESVSPTTPYLKQHTRLLLLLSLLAVLSAFIITHKILIIPTFTDSEVVSELDMLLEDTAPLVTERQIFLATQRENLPRKNMEGATVAVETEAAADPGVALDQTREEWQLTQTAADGAGTETQPSGGEVVGDSGSGEGGQSSSQGLVAGQVAGTVINTGTITLAGPVTVIDPLAIGTPRSVSITGSIFALDAAQSVMSFISEGGSDIRVEAPAAQIFIADTSMTFAELLPTDIIVVEGTQFEGSSTITATKITVVGVMDFTVPLTAPDVSVVNES